MCHLQMMALMVPLAKSISQQWITRVTWEFLLQRQMKRSSGALDMLSELLLHVPDPKPMKHESTSKKKNVCLSMSLTCMAGLWLLSMYNLNNKNCHNLSTDREQKNLNKMPPFLNEKHHQLRCNFSSYLKKASREDLGSRQSPKAGGVSG